MDTFSQQLITVISLLVGNTLFGTLPLFITKIFSGIGSNSQDQLKRLNIATFLLFFGGGVFISDSFLVLLPQTREYLEQPHDHEDDADDGAHSGHHHHSFPVPELIIVCSFFAAYVLKELIFFILCKLNSTARKSSDLRVQFCSCAKRHTECSRTFKEANPNQLLFNVDNKSENAEPLASRPQQMTTAQTDLLRSSIIAQTIPNYGTLTNITEPAADSPLPILSPPVLLAEEQNHTEQAVLQNQSWLIIGSLLTILALMFQFLFFGFALAQQTTSPTRWYSLALACSQNFILTFSACSDFATHDIELTYVAMSIALLSTVSPVGLIIAMIKSDFVESLSSTSKGISAAVACGVMIYTTFYEVLKKQDKSNVTGIVKFTAIISGASVMAALHYAALTL